MKHFESINPYNGERLETFMEFSSRQVDRIIEKSDEAHFFWRKSPMSERARLLRNLSEKLEEYKDDLAITMTLEMGKPITQSKAEIEKCGWVCRYYAENAADFLEDKYIKTDAKASFVRYSSLGPVLAIMPWNFPFWQVMRFAAPATMAGNTVLLKHSPNTWRCAIWIERLFKEAGYPDGVFQTLLIDTDIVAGVIKDRRVKGVTLTGSVEAGSAVASTAGKYIKKSVLELGGSNSYIVFEDADIDLAVETGIMARFLNSGQSCIAAKRFILAEDIAEEFTRKFVEKVKELKSGNPMEEDTFIGPLARVDLAENLERQLNNSLAKGAEVWCGGKRDSAYFEPTVVANVRPEMPVFAEETFGPLAAISVAKDEAEAIALANQSAFGLGVTVFTENIVRKQALIDDLDGGAVFFNDMVKSDPRLPFGGTGVSGFGRELSEEGIREFVNVKTIYMK